MFMKLEKYLTNLHPNKNIPNLLYPAKMYLLSYDPDVKI